MYNGCFMLLIGQCGYDIMLEGLGCGARKRLKVSSVLVGYFIKLSMFDAFGHTVGKYHNFMFDIDVVISVVVVIIIGVVISVVFIVGVVIAVVVMIGVDHFVCCRFGLVISYPT